MDFISGMELSKSFYFEIVRPLLQKNFPEVRYASGLLGTGSEVQGFDDPTSIDHHWGVRLLLFLEENDFKSVKSKLNIFFCQNLPYEFKGHSTHWSSPDPNDSNNQFPMLKSEGEINHRIEIYTVSGFLKDSLGINGPNLSEIDWLLLSEQRLREFTREKCLRIYLGALLKLESLSPIFLIMYGSTKLLVNGIKSPRKLRFREELVCKKMFWGVKLKHLGLFDT